MFLWYSDQFPGAGEDISQICSWILNLSLQWNLGQHSHWSAQYWLTNRSFAPNSIDNEIWGSDSWYRFRVLVKFLHDMNLIIKAFIKFQTFHNINAMNMVSTEKVSPSLGFFLLWQCAPSSDISICTDLGHHGGKAPIGQSYCADQ